MIRVLKPKTIVVYGAILLWMNTNKIEHIRSKHLHRACTAHATAALNGKAAS